MPIDMGFGQEDQQSQPKQPLQASLSGNPLVDFFNSVGGGAIRGAQQGIADVGTTLGTMTGSQGIKDWANRTGQDVSQSTPDYTGHPALGLINQVAEQVGGTVGPIAAGMAAAAAAPEEMAIGAAMAGGAAAMAPIGFGSAKTEAIQRGADDATANRIGLEGAVLQSSAFVLPMHQILAGGPIIEKVLKNAAVNAGAGLALSYGQEEIMKANDIRPLPDGQEFNNTMYSALVGGLSGAIFGAFSPDEMMPHVNNIVDTHMSPSVQAQLAAEYRTQGMTQEQADAKALQMVEDKRPQMIQEAQAMYLRARFSLSNLLKGNYDVVNQNNTPTPQKVFVRDLGGMTSEYELRYPNASPETNEEASKIINAGLAEPQVDGQGNVKEDPKNPGIPLLKRSMSPDLPNIARILLHDDIVKQIEASKDDQITTRLNLVAAIKKRELPIMSKNNFIYVGAAHGEPSETQNSAFHFHMGSKTIGEVAGKMIESDGQMHPQSTTMYHMGDQEGVEDTYKLLIDSYRQKEEESKRLFPTAVPDENKLPEGLVVRPLEEGQNQFDFNKPAEPEVQPQHGIVHNEPVTPGSTETVNETPEEKANREQLEKLEAINKLREEAKSDAVKTTKEYKALPSSDVDGMFHAILEDATGVAGETTAEDVTAEEKPFGEESKARDMLTDKEKQQAVMGEPLQRNYLNTISDFVKQLHNIFNIGKDAPPQVFGSLKSYEFDREKPVTINLAEINAHIKTIQGELEMRKNRSEHVHGEHYVPTKYELERMGAPHPTPYVDTPSDELMRKLQELERSKKDLQKSPEPIHGSEVLTRDMIDDVQKNLQSPNKTAMDLKDHYDEILKEMRTKLEEEGLWEDLDAEFGPGVLDDPTGLKMMEVLKERIDRGQVGEDNDYKKDVIGEVQQGKEVKQFEPNTMVRLSGTDVRTGKEVTNVEVDGKFIWEKKTIGDKVYFEIKDGHHILVPANKWIDMVKESGGAFKITTIQPVENTAPKTEQLKESGRQKIAMQATEGEKKLITHYDSMVKSSEWKMSINPLNWKEVKEVIDARTKGMAEKDKDAIAQEITRMHAIDMPSVLTQHVVEQLGIQAKGEEIKTSELNADPANVRSLPLKYAFKAAIMFGRRQDFLNWARNHYQQQFPQMFQVKPPADIAQEIITGLKTDKMTKDLIRHIATDNLSGAQREAWNISTGITKGLMQKQLVKDAKPATIKKVTLKFGELMSLASEERRPDGTKTYLGTQQQIARSGQPGTEDEWRVRDNFNKKYIEHIQFWGLPMPQSMDVRPDLAFTNILKQVGGDRADHLLMWVKNEMEEPSFQSMIKAGVFDQTGIQANVAFGYTPRIHDFKGLQKEYQQGRGGVVGDPTKSSGVLQRDAYDFSDFLARSEKEGLDTVPNYIDAMSEYVQQSLGKTMQYNALNWVRMFRIPNSESLRLPMETPEIRDVIRNLNYVEYTSSPNIVKLAELSKLSPNAVLGHLGYFNKKDAEGLIGWDKFHFQKPFMQASLSDVLDFYYPKTAWQSEGVSQATSVLNFPKWMMVTLDPLQHVALFSTAVLGNSGWRLPVVMGRWAAHSVKAIANILPEAIQTAKGEHTSNYPWWLGGGLKEPGFDNQENLALFLAHGHGAALGTLPEGMFQDQKIQKWLIPEMMTGAQGIENSFRSTLGATKIMFGHFLQREIYAVTNQRFNMFRKMLGPDGQPLMTKDEAARRAVTLINSSSGIVHASDFGPNGPAWSLLTFARGLTIAPLRVISGTIEPTLRKIYGNTNKFKIDPFSGFINPISMGDLSVRDADFLQGYFAQNLARVIAMRVLAAGVVQYAMSFQDDDKKDEFGQQGHDPLNKKRFIYNNPAGMRMGIRTPWTDINGRRIMLNPTPFREGAQMVDMSGIGSKYHFPESTINWIKNRLNVWEGLMIGAAYGTDIGTGQEIPGKGTDEYPDELTKWMMAKVMPLSFGVTEQEKEQKATQPGAEPINRLGAFLGTTPTVAPKGWFPGYEESQKVENEYKLMKQKIKDSTKTMTEQQVMQMKLNNFFTAKERLDIARGKDPSYTATEVMRKMKMGAQKIKEEEQAQLMQSVNTGE